MGLCREPERASSAQPACRGPCCELRAASFPGPETYRRSPASPRGVARSGSGRAARFLPVEPRGIIGTRPRNGTPEGQADVRSHHPSPEGARPRGPLRSRGLAAGHRMGRALERCADPSLPCLPPRPRGAARPWVRLLVVKAARRLRREGWLARRLGLGVERMDAPPWQGVEPSGSRERRPGLPRRAGAVWAALAADGEGRGSSGCRCGADGRSDDGADRGGAGGAADGGVPALMGARVRVGIGRATRQGGGAKGRLQAIR